jgi:hypothetical protein
MGIAGSIQWGDRHLTYHHVHLYINQYPVYIFYVALPYTASESETFGVQKNDKCYQQLSVWEVHLFALYQMCVDLALPQYSFVKYTFVAKNTSKIWEKVFILQIKDSL